MCTLIARDRESSRLRARVSLCVETSVSTWATNIKDNPHLSRSAAIHNRSYATPSLKLSWITIELAYHKQGMVGKLEQDVGMV